ncbi:MAG: hypothetical protein RLZZ11_1096, partial [Cyanobacteriota bacterium]
IHGSHHRQQSDTKSRFFAVRLEAVLPVVRAVDVNGFKFLYELLAVSRGRLRVAEVPLTFQPRLSGSSKLDLAVFWDFLISLLHSLCLRLLPRRAISFALVGGSGVVVQLGVTHVLLSLSDHPLKGAESLALVGALTAACSNYLINNALTFRFNRLKGLALLRGLVRFLMVSSLPMAANVGIAQLLVRLSPADPLIAQLAGILVVFVWNYAASSRFVWNTP